jgi:hypothetical protein
MIQYTVTLTDAENKALGYFASSQQDWIDNVVHERCRIAIDEIVKICVEKCLETSTQIPGSKDEMALLAFENGWVKTDAEQNNESTQIV